MDVSEDDIRAEASVNLGGEAMIQGGIAFERKYTLNALGQMYYQDFTLFTGLAGNYAYEAKVDVIGKESEWGIEAKNTPTTDYEDNVLTDFILMKPEQFVSAKTPVFNLFDKKL